jgi:Uncharacterised protein family (UPF0175)
MNRSLRIEYPSTLPDALYQTPSEFEQGPASPWRSSSLEMKRISSGQAAQLAGMDRTTFLMLLAESGLTMINLRANSDIGGRL